MGEAAGIAGDFNGGQFGGQLETGRLGHGADQLDTFCDSSGKVEGLTLQGLLAGVVAGEFEEGFDKAAHALGSALAGFDGLLVIFGGAFASQGHLGLGEDDGDRRAQFVGGIGSELALLGEGRFQAGERGIQDGGELAEFAFRLGDIDALGKVAGGNLDGSGTDGGDGLDGERDQPGAAGEADEENDAANAGERKTGPVKFRQFGRDAAADNNSFAGRGEHAGFAEGPAGPRRGVGSGGSGSRAAGR